MNIANVKIKVQCKEKTNEQKEKLYKHLSIYNNFKEYNIDRLNLRKQPKKNRLFFTSPASKKCRAMHIVLDKNDLSKSYKTMQMLCNYAN